MIRLPNRRYGRLLQALHRSGARVKQGKWLTSLPILLQTNLLSSPVPTLTSTAEHSSLNRSSMKSFFFSLCFLLSYFFSGAEEKNPPGPVVFSLNAATLKTNQKRIDSK